MSSLLPLAQQNSEIHQQNLAYQQKLDEYQAQYQAQMERRCLLTNSYLHDIVNGIMPTVAISSLTLTTSDLTIKGLRITAFVTIPIWILSAVLICKIFLDIVLPVSKEETFLSKRKFKPSLVLGSLCGFVASCIIIGEKFNLSPLFAKPLLVQASVLFPSVFIGSIVGVISIRQFMKSS